jgi:hypothetical protein
MSIIVNSLDFLAFFVVIEVYLAAFLFSISSGDD